MHPPSRSLCWVLRTVSDRWPIVRAGHSIRRGVHRHPPSAATDQPGGIARTLRSLLTSRYALAAASAQNSALGVTEHCHCRLLC